MVRALAGDCAGSLHKTLGYWFVSVGGRKYLAHRIVFELVTGEIPLGYEIDHKDGDRSNNLVSNLQAVPKRINTRNKGLRKTNTSGINGVWKEVVTNKGKTFTYWTASCIVDSRKKTRSFNIDKYGEAEAFRLACEERSLMISSNESGGDYSYRHTQLKEHK